MATRRLGLEAVISAKNNTKQAFREVNKDVSKLVGVVNGLGAMRLATALGGLFAVRKVGQFALSASQDFMALEQSLRNVNTMAKLSEKDFEALTNSVIKLSTKVPQTAQELSEGLYKVVSAGVSAENQMAFLTDAAKFATAGATDMDTAVQGLVSTIKGFNLAESDATMVADLFFQANKFGITTVGDMANAMQQVSSLANAFGFSLEQTMSVFGTFTGVTGDANRVATQLVASLKAINQVSPEVRARVDEYNKAHKDSQLILGKSAWEGKNFNEVARQMWEVVGKDAEALRKLIPDAEAAKLIITAATTQYERFNFVLGEMENASGSMHAAFMEQMKGQQNQLKLLTNSWNSFKLQFGRLITPIIRSIVEFGTVMLETADIIGSGLMVVGKSIGIFFSGMFFGVIKGFKTFANKMIDLSNTLLSKLPFTDEKPIDFRFDTEKTQQSLDFVGSLVDGLTADLSTLRTKFISVGSTEPLMAQYTDTVEALGTAMNNNTVAASDFGQKVKETTKAATKEQESLNNSVKEFIKTYQSLTKSINDESISFQRSQLDKNRTFKEQLADMVAEHKSKWEELISDRDAALKEMEDSEITSDEKKVLTDKIAALQQQIVAENRIIQPYLGREDLASLAARTDVDRLVEANKREQAESTVRQAERIEGLQAQQKSITINFDFTNATVTENDFINKVKEALGKSIEVSTLTQ